MYIHQHLLCHAPCCCNTVLSSVLQRVAIKKQFFLSSLQLHHPQTATTAAPSMASPTPVEAPSPDTSLENRSISSFSRISVVLAAPPMTDSPSTPGQQLQGSAAAPASSPQETKGHVPTGENMRVFLELKAIVPLQFGAAHAVNSTPAGTLTLTVRS